MKKIAQRFVKYSIFGFVLFWIGWFASIIYSEPSCSNIEIAEDLIWPASFNRGFIHQVEYVEILRKSNDTGEVVQAAVMDRPEDIVELFSHSSDQDLVYGYMKIDTHLLHVRMKDGKLVRFFVFNDYDLDGEVMIENAYCFGFRGIGDVKGAERTRRMFSQGWRKIWTYMYSE